MTDPHAGVSLFEPDDGQPAPSGRGGRRRARRRRGRGLGCLVLVLVFVAGAGGLYWAVDSGLDSLRGRFSAEEPPADYPGPGSGEIAFQVRPGQSAAEIGRNLKAQGVVASVDAFTAAVADADAGSSIQAGTFTLQREMRAADAVTALTGVGSSAGGVTIPEGLRVTEIVERLVEGTDISKAQFDAALEDGSALGLPAYADGEAEGYLFPATYSFAPDATATEVLREMVTRWKQAADDAGLAAASQRLGYSPHELVTIASLVEAEGRGDYMPMISRVIYNRLDTTGYPTFGKLQIDATVNYAAGNTLGAVPTTEDLQIDSPYNTYANAGLPPGPIEAPGQEALEAAANPRPGDWLFYVTVNLRTAETKFTDDYDTFLAYKRELQEYCRTESAGAC